MFTNVHTFMTHALDVKRGLAKATTRSACSETWAKVSGGVSFLKPQEFDIL